MKSQIKNNKITFEFDIKELAEHFQEIHPEYEIISERKFAEALLNYIDFDTFGVLQEIIELEGDNIVEWADKVE